jgi:hypothetical protein
MNNEQQQIIDESYNNYLTYIHDVVQGENQIYGDWYGKEEFINKCKTEDALSIKWIEEYGDLRHGSKEEIEHLSKHYKTDPEFSERWGLKIEERELSLEEKEWQLEKTHCINDIENDRIIYGHEWEKYIQKQYEGIQSNQGINIPTKLITITYNDKTIESYE